jgi:hypothetical protein
MTKSEALGIVLEAADAWVEEIVTYIIPDGHLEGSELDERIDQANAINEAMQKLDPKGHGHYASTRYSRSDFA